MMKNSNERTFRKLHDDSIWCDKRSLIKLEENKIEYIATNTDSKTICCYKTDTGKEAHGQKMCDYALCVCSKNNNGIESERIILVELKGSDIEHAIKQINATIKSKITDHDLNPFQVDARIVSSKVRSPNYISTSVASLKKRLRQFGERKGDLIIKSRQIKEKV